MIKKITYHYANLDLETIEGEKWASVFGYDGEYEVSSFGRIKSLRRWRSNGKGGSYTKEIIRKQNERISFNKLLKEKTYTIGISLKRNNIGFSTSTARYVYHAFVEPFNFDDKNLVITFKDSDSRNLHYKNLMLTTKSELSKRAHILNRKVSPTEKVSVEQYSISGKLLYTFKSITDAAEQTGFHITGIMACMLHQIHQHKGYKWEYANKQIAAKAIVTSSKFNNRLWEKLDKPKISKKNPPPVFNLSSETLEGEKWKILESFMGIYYISNFGRLKSTSRLTTGKHTKWRNGIIKKLSSDNKIGEKASTILCSLRRDKTDFQLSVARLVYYHFVKKFDLKDNAIIIKYKDGCKYNLDAKNLMLGRKQFE